MSREKSDSFSTDDSSATSVSLRVQQLDSTDSGLPEKPLFSLPRLRRRVRGACTLKLLKRRLPFLEWIPRCTVQSVIYDALAGFTVALTSIPQSIAYAAVAGIPLEVFYLTVGFKMFLNITYFIILFSMDCTQLLLGRSLTFCLVQFSKLRWRLLQ